MQRHMLEHTARQGAAVKEFMYVFYSLAGFCVARRETEKVRKNH